MDRIKEITVKPFKPHDKKVITHQFLINEMCELVGFDKGAIKIEDDVIDFIVEHYTNEPGVRELKRKLEKIFLKLNIDRIYNTGLFEKKNTITKHRPVTLTKEVVEENLGNEAELLEVVENQSELPDDIVSHLKSLF